MLEEGWHQYVVVFVLVNTASSGLNVSFTATPLASLRWLSCFIQRLFSRYYVPSMCEHINKDALTWSGSAANLDADGLWHERQTRDGGREGPNTYTEPGAWLNKRRHKLWLKRAMCHTCLAIVFPPWHSSIHHTPTASRCLLEPRQSQPRNR